MIRGVGQGREGWYQEDASGGLVPDSDTGREEQGDTGSWLLEAVGSRREGCSQGAGQGGGMSREGALGGLSLSVARRGPSRGKPLLFRRRQDRKSGRPVLCGHWGTQKVLEL